MAPLHEISQTDQSNRTRNSWSDRMSAESMIDVSEAKALFFLIRTSCCTEVLYIFLDQKESDFELCQCKTDKVQVEKQITGVGSFVFANNQDIDKKIEE